MRFKKRVGKKVSNLLDLPQYLLLDLPCITIEGNISVVIENYISVIEYKTDYVRIQTNEGGIRIEGKNLEVEALEKDIVKIIGKINAVLIQTKEA